MEMFLRVSMVFLICLSGKLALAQSPNIVFILIDDQGWTGTSHQMKSTLGTSQSDYYQTPNLEQLAQQGMTFSQAYSPASKCSPSRNSILTGQTPAISRLTNTSVAVDSTKFLYEPSSAIHIDQSLKTFPELIEEQNANYWTAHYGKWHLGSGGPAASGFHRSDGNTSNNTGTQGLGIQADPKLVQQITDSALAFISDAKAANKPFYVQLSHYAVHAPSELLGTTYNFYATPGQRPIGIRHTDTLYAGMTEDVDRTVGQLLDSLTAWGLDSNTYVVYMSDNGSGQGFSNNLPLQQGKAFLNEGGIRVPLVIRGPNIPQNTYNDIPVIGYDLYPTFMDWMFGNISLPSNVEGVSIKNLVTGLPVVLNRSNGLIFHSPHYAQSNNKYPESAIIKDSFKFMVNYDLGAFYLYNLNQDIEEQHDLDSIYPHIADSLCLELRNYLKNSNAQMPTLNPTHPNNANGVAGDWDNDGLNDAWEFRELLTVKYNASDDPDNDGFDNATEQANNTDPYVSNTSTSITNIGNEMAVRIFPNPAHHTLQIEGDVDFDKAWLYDYTGQSVVKRSRNKALNVRNLPAGAYFLVLWENGARVYTQEVTVSH